MSDSEEHSYHGTEMRNMTEGPAKPKGCCTRHPRLCCSCLVFMLVLAAVVGALLGGLFALIESEVDNAIGEVGEHETCLSRCLRRGHSHLLRVVLVWLRHITPYLFWYDVIHLGISP